jgi:hypothetical protein
MKFLLTIQICSAIMSQCTQPVEMGSTYNSHYDCATAGFIKGITALRELGEEYVNEKRMLMNFACKSQETT